MKDSDINRGTLIALFSVLLSAIPISKVFTLWSPDPLAMFIGALLSLLTLPAFVFIVSTESRLKHRRLAMFFSPLLFASAIDFIIGLEHDGLIAGYMAFYLSKGEPYLGTPYGAAISYWDGIVHQSLCWIMLYDFYKGYSRFRAFALYWFGSFFTSMIILLIGSLTGPFPLHYSIFLNVIYVLIPIGYLIWILRSTKPHKSDSTFATTVFGEAVRLIFVVSFILLIAMVIIKGLVAVGGNRELLSFYVNQIDKPIVHAYQYPRVAVLVFLFYGIPYFVYSVYCLLRNEKTSLVVELSVLFAGVSAQAQAAYIGPYLVWKPEVIEFENSTAKYLFWGINLALMIIPQLFAIYCYNSHPKSDKNKSK